MSNKTATISAAVPADVKAEASGAYPLPPEQREWLDAPLVDRLPAGGRKLTAPHPGPLQLTLPG